MRSAATFTSRAQHCPGGSPPPWAARLSPAIFARRQISRRDQSAYPFAKSRNAVSGSIVADPVSAPRLACANCPTRRFDPSFCSGRSGCSRVELSLLRGHSAHQRRDRHHRAIHRSGLGSALHGGAWRAASIVATKLGRRTGRCRLHSRGRPRRLGRFSHGYTRSHRRPSGCFLIRLLQRRRTHRPRPLRSLEGSALGAGRHVRSSG